MFFASDGAQTLIPYTKCVQKSMGVGVSIVGVNVQFYDREIAEVIRQSQWVNLHQRTH